MWLRRKAVHATNRLCHQCQLQQSPPVFVFLLWQYKKFTHLFVLIHRGRFDNAERLIYCKFSTTERFAGVVEVRQTALATIGDDLQEIKKQ